MTFEEIQKNGRAIVLKSVTDAVGASITVLLAVAVGSLGLSLYRLSNGKPIQGNSALEEEDGP